MKEKRGKERREERTEGGEERNDVSTLLAQGLALLASSFTWPPPYNVFHLSSMSRERSAILFKVGKL